MRPASKFQEDAEVKETEDHLRERKKQLCVDLARQQHESKLTNVPLPRQSYSLATLLLGMTVFSVWLTLIIKLPCAGMSCLIFLLPAVVRTIAAVNVHKRHGISTSLQEKLLLIVESGFACFGAFILFAFYFSVSILVLLVISAIAAKLLPKSEIFENASFVILYGGIGIGFLVALLPAIYVLALDWPREYDLQQKRFLTLAEIRERAALQAAYAITLSPNKPPCSECHVPGMPTETPCKVCGRVGPNTT